MAQENTVTINNQEYKASDLSAEAKTQLVNLQVTDQEIARQESLLAMLRTARAAYGQKLSEALKGTKSTTKTKAKAKAVSASKAAVNDKPATKVKPAEKAAPKTKK